MVNRLLSAFTISLFLFFLTAHLQPAFAQNKKHSAGYFYLLKSIIVVKQQVSLPKATPTVFVYATPTQTPQTPNPTKTIAKITPKTTQLTVAPTIIPSTKPIKPTEITPSQMNQQTDPMAFIMKEINAYRVSLGLSAVQTSDETCSFAAIRAAEIVTNFSHDGFQNRIDSKTLPYKTWSKVTENIAMTSDYKQVVSMWKNSPGHAENMRADTPFVCVRQNGNYFAYVGMKP